LSTRVAQCGPDCKFRAPHGSDTHPEINRSETKSGANLAAQSRISLALNPGYIRSLTLPQQPAGARQQRDARSFRRSPLRSTVADAMMRGAILPSTEPAMRHYRIVALALALCTSAAFAGPGRADALLTSGIGLSRCDKLGPDLKPGAGLDHLPNALLFYWVQGYLSAANIFLLNEYNDYVDLGRVEEPAITKLVAAFCADNPDKKPISAIDKFIRDAEKVEAKESDTFDPWKH
jgi:hypothetical protein